MWHRSFNERVVFSVPSWAVEPALPDASPWDTMVTLILALLEALLGVGLGVCLLLRWSLMSSRSKPSTCSLGTGTETHDAGGVKLQQSPIVSRSLRDSQGADTVNMKCCRGLWVQIKTLAKESEPKLFWSVFGLCERCFLNSGAQKGNALKSAWQQG